MIVIYINGEGTAEKLSPEHVYQGSNQTGVTVFAPVPTTTALGIAFKLPDGTSTTYYPMTYIQSVEGLSQYEFTIPSSITQLAGHSTIALSMTFTDGRQTSQLVEFEIEPSVLPELPSDIDEDAYAIIMRYLAQDRSDITALQGQIDGIEETADSAEKASAEALETANAAESKIDGAIQEIADYKTDVDTKIEELETQIAEGQGTIVEVDGKEQAKVSFTSDPQEQLDNLKATDEDQQEQLNSLKSTDEEQQEQLNSLKSTDEEQQEQLNSLKSTDEEQQEQIDGKVNKEGDTMTGPLIIESNISAAHFIQVDGSKDYVAFKAGNNIFGVGGENATVYRLQQMFRTDPTKLNPTTANGWTVGTATMSFPTNLNTGNVILVSINSSTPTLVVIPASSLIFTFTIALQNETAPVKVTYNGISTSTKWTLSSGTITSVAYKILL